MIDTRRLLVVAPQFLPVNGGYANAITSFVRALEQFSTLYSDVLVLGHLGVNNQRHLRLTDRIVVTYCPRPVKRFRWLRPFNEIVRVFYLVSFLTRRGSLYDFILFETIEHPWPKLIAMLAAKKWRSAAVRIHASQETEHYVYGRGLFHALNRLGARAFLRRIPNIIATNRYHLEFVKKHYLKDNVFDTFKNYAVVPNVSSVGTVRRADVSTRDRQLALLILGRFDRQGYIQKNYELLAHAVWLLAQRHPEVYRILKILVVGNGEWLGKYRQLLEDINIAERFDFLGEVQNSEVRRLQAEVDFVLLLSRYEGHSMFGLEAIAEGAAVIFSKITPLAEMVKDGVNGFLVDCDDPFDLERVLRLAEKADARAMGMASRQLYYEKFSSGDTVQKFVQFMQLARHSIK